MTATQQRQIEAMCVKAACTGFTQTLINKGYPEDLVKEANVAYAHPEQGLLVKRAANINRLRQGILQCVDELRYGR